MNPNVWRVALGVISSLLVLFGIGWLFYRAFKNSEDPTQLLMKWGYTLVVLLFIFYVVFPIIADGGYGAAFGGVPLAAASGITLAIIWRRSIGEIIASPLSSIFDGGDQEVEAHAVYSKAESLRRRNLFSEAIAEIRRELEKFPDDFSGQLLMAQINAEDLRDIQSADIIIQKMINQPAHTPAQIVGALHSLADWHLQLAQDPESAREALGKIVARFPDSQYSLTAQQRMAHLGTVDSLLATHERPTITLKHFDPYARLKNNFSAREPEPVDAAQRAANCLKQLELHPLDSEAREKLALIYAEDYQRLDLAVEQLEELIAQPNRRPREVARWLNLLADLQIQHANDVPAATQTVRRITELFPSSAYADQALLRLEYLRGESKRHEKTQGIKLGVYERDLGLKKKPSIRDDN